MSGDQKHPKRPMSRRGFMTGVSVGAVGTVIGRDVIAQEFESVGSLDDWEAFLRGETPDSSGPTEQEPDTETTEPVDPNPPIDTPNPPPASSIAIRRDIYTLREGGREVQSLRRGIAEMRRRSDVNPSDPTGWLFQANIHAGRAGPNIQECQHSNRFFLSWHRMYLFFFEQILRQASGDPSLTLPYWDYSISGRATLPPQFLPPLAPRLPFELQQPAPPPTEQNPLYWPLRNEYYNQGGALPSNITETEATLAAPTFDNTFSVGFNSALEGTPHNGVHRMIGGSMGNAVTAGQDPIFWFHHCNIDRQWNRWLTRGGTRRNPSDIGFLAQRFNFYDQNGTIVAMTGEQVLDTTSTLSYRYDDDPLPQVGFTPAFAIAAATPPPPSAPAPTAGGASDGTPPPVAFAAAMVAPAPAALPAPAPMLRRVSQTLAENTQAVRLGSGQNKVRLASAFPRRTQTVERRVVSRPAAVMAAPSFSAASDGIAAPRAPQALSAAPEVMQLEVESVVMPAPEMFATAIGAPDSTPVILQLKEFEFAAGSVVYNIFVNLPDGEEPDPRGPYYAAYFAPFAQDKTDEPESFDITGLLNRQIEGGLWDGGEIDVQFVAIDASGQVATVVRDPVSIGQVSILRQ